MKDYFFDTNGVLQYSCPADKFPLNGLLFVKDGWFLRKKDGVFWDCGRIKNGELVFGSKFKGDILGVAKDIVLARTSFFDSGE